MQYHCSRYIELFAVTMQMSCMVSRVQASLSSLRTCNCHGEVPDTDCFVYSAPCAREFQTCLSCTELYRMRSLQLHPSIECGHSSSTHLSNAVTPAPPIYRLQQQTVRFGLEREQLLCAMNDASCVFRSGVCVGEGVRGGAITNI